MRLRIIELQEMQKDGGLHDGDFLDESLQALRTLAERTLRMPDEVTQILGQGGSSVDVNQCVRDAIKTLGIPPKVKLHPNLDERIPRLPLYCFDVVVQNLLQNAVDAMPEGGQLHVSTLAMLNPKLPTGYFQLVVRDTGQGMPPDVQKRIFELNFTTKREKGKGLGLGMWWVRNFVRRARGDITIHTIPGSGHRGHRQDPGGPAGQHRDRGRRVTAMSRGGTAVRLSENILIVEDEDEWRGVYSRAVDSRGSSRRIMVAEDLAAAKRLILAARFAVAFVDVGLDASDDQNVDGLQVMRWLRDTGDGTSIIVVTGRSGQDALRIGRDAIKEYGAFNTVGKSTVTPAQLRNLLDGGLEAFRDSQEKRDGKAGGTAARDALRGQHGRPGRQPGLGPPGHGGNRFQGQRGQVLPVPRRSSRQLPPGRRPAAGRTAVVDASAGLVHGDYWSRAQAGGIVVCFGQAAAVDRALLERGRDGQLLGQYSAGESAEELTAADGAVKGVVLLLRESQREDFRGESGRTEDRSASGLSG